MRPVATILVLFALSIAACSGADKQRSVSAIRSLPVQMDLSGYSRIHEFDSKQDGVLAGLYGKSIALDVFSELLVVDERGSSKRVIYLLDKNRFLGTHGIDTEPESSGFYGYKVVLKSPDYFVVNYMSNGGKNVSDDVTISWNSRLERFELEKTP